jgi:hypothetical protein
VHAELLELLLADDARRVHRHEEEREAVVARVGSVFVTSTITSARWPLVM